MIGFWRNGIPIGKPGAIINIRGSGAAQRKIDIASEVQRVSLIMIQQKITSAWWREIMQPAIDSAFTLCYLVRIRNINLGAFGNLRGSQRQFPTTYQRTINSKRKEDIRIPNTIMVEIILSPGTKSVDI